MIAPGQQYQRLTVISEAPQEPRWIRRWLCWCDCGNELVVRGSNLRSGHARSCGCLAIENTRSANTTHGYTKGRRVTPEFISWAAMIDRCRNAKSDKYRHYGGRGISVCDAWRDDFGAFMRDMGPRPSLKHSIDRKDNNGNYEPTNCRWATRAEQAINQRSNRLITYRGETKPLCVGARGRV